MSKINAMVPPARSSRRATSALPPLYGVPTSTEWRALRHQSRPSLIERLLRRKSA